MRHSPSTAHQARPQSTGTAWLSALLLALLLPATPWAQTQVCDLSLVNCPETYNGDTITVPDNVVAMSNQIAACKAAVVFENSSAGMIVPAIMFVIDHSGSMTSGTGYTGRDVAGARFTVTRALLDTIWKLQPNAEVGVVVFQEHLYFDTTSTDYFAQYFQALKLAPNLDGAPSQAYLRLLKLNQSYGGRLGIDIIKDVLATEQAVSPQGGTYTDLQYHPNFTHEGYTNINGAFLGARQAFQSTAIAKDNQFVIFLSDGEQNSGGGRSGLPDTYWQGGDTVPTTFTVFFTDNGQVPQSINTMTTKIQNNRYSLSNPQSTYHAMEADYDALMRFLIDNVFTRIFVSAAPTKMVVNATRTSFTYVDNAFLFNTPIALQSVVTPIRLAITYRYVDPTTGDAQDSVITTTFYIRRQSGAPVPSDVTLDCRDIPPPTSADSIPVIAALLDTSGDGHLDKIELSWTDNITLSGTPTVESLIDTMWLVTLDGNKAVSLKGASLVIDEANKKIYIILQENTGPTLETGWSEVKIQLTKTPLTDNNRHFYVAEVRDGAGPVVKDVKYYRDPATGRDSLKVTFSEPVNWPGEPSTAPAQVFNYYDQGTLKPDPWTGTTADSLNATSTPTVVYPGNFTVVPGEDSLQLIRTTLLTDQNGNQAPSNGRKAPIIGIGESKVVIANNPFIPGVTALDPRVVQLYTQVITNQTGGSSTTPGTIIGVSTQRELVPMGPDAEPGASDPLLTSYGKAYVFDAVGNVVRKNLGVYKAGDAAGAHGYGVFWDGKNDNERFVGAGTYLMMITTQEVGGKKHTSRVKVGVRRR